MFQLLALAPALVRSPWTLVGVAVFVFAYYKVLPLAWHVRVFCSYYRHYYFDKRRIPASTPTSLTLFQPSIFTSLSPLGEIDYNLHKSNSTYLSDLDLARGHHIYCLFRRGINKYKGYPENRHGMFVPALGGTNCTFKREIKPYQTFEVWTRVLAWDQKWFYFVSHFVKAGAVKPSVFSDQPWRTASRVRAVGEKTFVEGGAVDPCQAKDGQRRDGEDCSREEARGANISLGPAQPIPHPAIYATCVSKIVMKQGRKTIPPLEFLRACELVPERRGGQKGSGSLGSPTSCSGEMTNADLARDAETWAAIEKRQKEGLAVAAHVGAMDAAFDFFSAEEEVAFGKY